MVLQIGSRGKWTTLAESGRPFGGKWTTFWLKVDDLLAESGRPAKSGRPFFRKVDDPSKNI